MLLTTILICLVGAQPPRADANPVKAVESLIRSRDWKERVRAYGVAVNGVIGFQREEAKPFLLDIVRKNPLMPPPMGPNKDVDARNSPRGIALSILAHWHDPQLVPVFIEHLNDYSRDLTARGSIVGGEYVVPTDSYAAVKGLINVGKPALEPVVQELIKSKGLHIGDNHPDRFEVVTRHENLNYALWGILGHDGARQFLAKKYEQLRDRDPATARKVRYLMEHVASEPLELRHPKRVTSATADDRRLAYGEALNGLIGIRREKMKPFLLDVIKTNPLVPPGHGRVFDSKETEFSPRRVGLSILAEWHDASLIPLFMEYIDYQAPDPYRSQEPGVVQVPSDLYAGVKGLINIGKPALRPCVDELLKSPLPNESMRKSANDDQRRIYDRYNNLVYVIYGVLGPEAQKYLAAEAERVGKGDALAGEKLRQAAEFMDRNYRELWGGK
jgi:hypothetical protein